MIKFLIYPLVFGGLIALQIWRTKRRDGNFYMICVRMEEQLTDALANDELTWEDFQSLINSVRAVLNDSLSGWSKKKLSRPYMKITQTRPPQYQSRKQK